MSYASLRARLADRNVKPGARGTIETSICIDVSAVEALEAAQAELDLERRVDNTRTEGKPRLGTPRKTADFSRAEKAVEEAEAAVARETMRLVFRSLGSTDYNLLRAQHSDADDTAANEAFLNALCSWCLSEVYETDEDGVEQPIPTRPFDRETGLPDDEAEGMWFATDIAPFCSVGEWDQTTIRVASLNNRAVGVPLVARKSPTPSSPTSSSDETSRTASSTAPRPAGSAGGSRKRTPSTRTTKKGG